MQVILLKAISGVGKAGDIAQVPDSYARNFLLPKGLAAAATPAAVARHAQQQRARLERAEHSRLELDAAALKLQGCVLTVSSRAAANGKLFGSITAEKILESLKPQLGISDEHVVIKLDRPLDSVGTHSVQVALGKRVVAITVSVTALP